MKTPEEMKAVVKNPKTGITTAEEAYFARLGRLITGPNAGKKKEKT